MRTAWKAAPTLLLAAALIMPVQAREPVALTGATIIDGTGGPPIRSGVIIVDGNRIACIGTATACAVPGNAGRIDLAGRFITPGLIDAHVHFNQTGWLDGRPDGINAPKIYPYTETVAALRADPGRWHRAYLCSGITAVFDVGGAPWTVTGPQATDTDRPDRAHVRAAGPLTTHAHERNRYMDIGDPKQRVFLPMDSDTQAAENIAALKAMGSAAVKVWYLEPPEGRREELDQRLILVGRLARRAGLPLIVHATELRNAKQALKAGAALLVHSVEDVPVDKEFIDLLLANSAVYAPTLRVGRGWSRAMASVALNKPLDVDDPNRCVDEAILDRIAHPERLKPALDARFGGSMNAARIFARLERTGAREAQMAANLRAVSTASGRIVVATDAGNPLTLHGPSIYAEMEAMQAAGLTPDQILAAATAEGARLLGLDKDIGTLQKGKIADLVVLGKDPRLDVAAFRDVTHVMRAGVMKEQRELRVR